MSKLNSPFKKLFEPASIGTLKVKNRIVLPAMGTQYGSELGEVTPKIIDYYEERAKGGIGTIIVECTSIDYPLGAATLRNLSISRNANIAGHNELVETVKSYGAKIISQLWHAGRNAWPDNRNGLQPVAPSAIPTEFYPSVPKELTTSETKEIVKKFITGAIRAQLAGYDGVELHGAQGHLIGAFMSPRSNIREDEYGGDFRRRLQFPLEIIEGIRKELGPGYPIIFRLAADEFVEGGLRLEDTKKIAKILQEAGINAINVSAGTFESPTVGVDSMSSPEGWKIYLAEAIKKVVEIPIISVGPIKTPEFAENILKEQKVDFIAIGRSSLADPYWAEKAKDGRENEIIPCISCNDGCHRVFAKKLSVRCAVNPLTGRERLRNSFLPTKKKKNVLVIGGGPAGIMAALTAKERGHNVSLYEKSNRLGGQLCIGAKYKEKISRYLDYLIYQVNQKKINLILNKTVSKELILDSEFDAVITATGAVPLIPDIPGIENSSVCTAWDVFEGNYKPKDNNILIAGGGSVGCEVSLYLASTNNKVIVLEMMDDILRDVDKINRMDTIDKMEKNGIEVLRQTKIEKFESNGITVSNREGEQHTIKCDSVVMALGSVPVRPFIEDNDSRIDRYYAVGDCIKPRKIIDAVYEGFLAGLRV